MLDKLPDLIDPIASVNHHKHFVGRVNQGSLKRLVEAVVKTDGDVEADIQFYFDKAVKLPAFEMKLKAQLMLECQRSLNEFQYFVETSSKGVITESMALVEDLPSDYEVYELNAGDDRISLHEWVEEELLLAIPMIPVDKSTEVFPLNESDESGRKYEEPSLTEDESSDELEDSRPNPFAALKALKK